MIGSQSIEKLFDFIQISSLKSNFNFTSEMISEQSSELNRKKEFWRKFLKMSTHLDVD